MGNAPLHYCFCKQKGDTPCYFYSHIVGKTGAKNFPYELMEYTYIHSQILSLQQKTKTSAFELQTQHRMAIIPYEPKEEPSESRLRCRVGFALFCKYLLLSNTVAIVMPADQLRCGRCFTACKEISAKLKTSTSGHTRTESGRGHAAPAALRWHIMRCIPA